MSKGLTAALALALGLGGFWYFYEYKGREGRAKKSDEAKLLFPETLVAAPNEFSIGGAGKTGVLLKEEGGKWRLLSPLQDEAEAGQATAMIELLKTIKKEEDFAEPATDLAAFGLDKPTGSVNFRGISLKAQTLLFGAENPSQQYVYAMVQGGDKVYMVQKYSKTNLMKEPRELRNKMFWDFEPANVVKVNSTFGSGLKLEKGSDQKWRLLAPFAGECKNEEVNNWLTSLKNFRIEDFIAESASGSYGFGPRVEITLAGQPKPLVLYVGTKVKDKSSLHAKVDGRALVFSLGEYTKATLEKRADELVDNDAFSFKSWEVSRFEVQPKVGAALKAVKKDGNWSWDPAPPKKEGEADFDFFAFLSELSSAKVKGRLIKDYKIAAPDLVLTFFGEKGEVLEKVTVGPKGRFHGALQALSQSKAHAVEVDAALFSKLPK